MTTEGITPYAEAKASCWSTAVIAWTNATAWLRYGVRAEMPQHVVNDRVPSPAGPAGSACTVYRTSG
ncbi:hypothetical protein GCM10009662_23850 [Catellatospora coxensis]